MIRTVPSSFRFLTLAVLLAAAAGCSKQAAPAAPVESSSEPADDEPTSDLPDQAVFDASPDGVAAAARWMPQTSYSRPDGGKLELRAVDDVAAGTIALVDDAGAVLVMHEVAGSASEVQGRIAVLDDGRVLFDAGFLRGASAFSTIYWLRWDEATAALTVETSASFIARM